MTKEPYIVSQLLGLIGEAKRAPPSDVRARLQERDRRQESDHRSEVQKWLGDPPADRSALHARSSR